MNETFKIQRTPNSVEVTEFNSDKDLEALVAAENGCRYVKKDPVSTEHGLFVVWYPTYSTRDADKTFCFKSGNTCILVQGTCFVQVFDIEEGTMRFVKRTSKPTTAKYLEKIRKNIEEGMKQAGSGDCNVFVLQKQYKPLPLRGDANVPEGFSEQADRIHVLLERNQSLSVRSLQFMIMFSVFFKSQEAMPFEQTKMLVDVESAREDLSRSQLLETFKILQDAQVSTLAASYRLLSHHVEMNEPDAMQFAFENMANAIKGDEKLLSILDLTEQEATSISQSCGLVSVFPDIKDDIAQRASEFLFPLSDYDTITKTKDMIDQAEKMTEDALKKTEYVERYFSVPQSVFKQLVENQI